MMESIVFKFKISKSKYICATKWKRIFENSCIIATCNVTTCIIATCNVTACISTLSDWEKPKQDNCSLLFDASVLGLDFLDQTRSV